jgi:hypothetical protein
MGAADLLVDLRGRAHVCALSAILAEERPVERAICRMISGVKELSASGVRP